MKSIQLARKRWLAPAVGSRIGKNSLYSAIGYGVPVVATLVFTPLLLNSMGASNFGLWMIGISFLGLLGVFDLGLGTAVAKYIAESYEQRDISWLSATVTMGLLAYLAIGLLLTVPTYMIAPHAASLFNSDEVPYDTVVRVMRLAAFGFIPLMLKNAGLAVPIGLQRFKIPMTVSVVQSVLTLSLAFAVSRGGGSVIQVVVSSMIALWATAAVAVLIGYRMLHTLGAKILLSAAQAALMLKFTAFTSISGLGILLFSTVDRIVVGALLGPSAVAYYAVAAGIATNLVTIAGVLTQPLMPAASSWGSSDQWEKARAYLTRFTLAIAVLELALASILLLISGPFMNLWLGAELAAHVLTPFRILVLVYAVTALNAPAYHIANGSGLPQIPALGATVGGVLTVLLILILGGNWGLTGAAWANAGYWATLLIPVLTVRALKHQGAPDGLAAAPTRAAG